MNHHSRKILAPKTRFGNKVSFSQRHTRRTFKPNLQWVTLDVNGKSLRLLLSARQIRSLGKETPAKKLWANLRELAS
ncbi:MAG: 50S ribosomal protein L28 [Anaerolineae bacterium]|nr:50S ribosomal protein L28 [Anaerolineae bacterium]